MSFDTKAAIEAISNLIDPRERRYEKSLASTQAAEELMQRINQISNDTALHILETEDTQEELQEEQKKTYAEAINFYLQVIINALIANSTSVFSQTMIDSLRQVSLAYKFPLEYSTKALDYIKQHHQLKGLPGFEVDFYVDYLIKALSSSKKIVSKTNKDLP